MGNFRIYETAILSDFSIKNYIRLNSAPSEKKLEALHKRSTDRVYPVRRVLCAVVDQFV